MSDETPQKQPTSSVKAPRLLVSPSFSAWMSEAKRSASSSASTSGSAAGLFGAKPVSALNTWFLSGDAPSFVRVHTPGPLSAKQQPARNSEATHNDEDVAIHKGDFMDVLGSDPELQAAYRQAEREDAAAAAAGNAAASSAAQRDTSLQGTLQQLLNGLKQEREAVSQEGAQLVAACTAVSKPPPGTPPSADATLPGSSKAHS